MVWQDYADKHVNSPVILVSIAFNSGTRYYSNDYIRTATQGYKGNILSLPQISTSVGDIVRTYERGKITLLFNDSDYEFRTLYEAVHGDAHPFVYIPDIALTACYYVYMEDPELLWAEIMGVGASAHVGQIMLRIIEAVRGKS